MVASRAKISRPRPDGAGAGVCRAASRKAAMSSLLPGCGTGALRFLSMAVSTGSRAESQIGRRIAFGKRNGGKFVADLSQLGKRDDAAASVRERAFGQNP